ncbi:MAG: hypothetical protein Q7S96_03660 [bacterium]|nr:hypothetical protein [bacterium]
MHKQQHLIRIGICTLVLGVAGFASATHAQWVEPTSPAPDGNPPGFVWLQGGTTVPQTGSIHLDSTIRTNEFQLTGAFASAFRVMRKGLLDGYPSSGSLVQIWPGELELLSGHDGTFYGEMRGVGGLQLTTGSGLSPWTTWTPRLRIEHDTGNVGIGAVPDATHRVLVGGKLSATELCIQGVCQASWDNLGGGGEVTAPFIVNDSAGNMVFLVGDAGDLRGSGPAGALHIRTAQGELTIGPTNAQAAHYTTSTPLHWFNKGIEVQPGTLSSGMVDGVVSDLDLQTAGTSRLKISGTTGSVGIGGSPPTDGIRLGVFGDVGAEGIKLFGTGTQANLDAYVDDFYIDAQGDVQVKIDADVSVGTEEFRVNNGANATVFRIDESGTVGLGATTNQPLDQHVRLGVGVSGGGLPTLDILHPNAASKLSIGADATTTFFETGRNSYSFNKRLRAADAVEIMPATPGGSATVLGDADVFTVASTADVHIQLDEDNNSTGSPEVFRVLSGADIVRHYINEYGEFWFQVQDGAGGGGGLLFGIANVATGGQQRLGVGAFTATSPPQELLHVGKTLVGGVLTPGNARIEGNLSVVGTSSIGYEIVRSAPCTIGSNQLMNCVASCPSGKKLLGGGCMFSPSSGSSGFTFSSMGPQDPTWTNASASVSETTWSCGASNRTVSSTQFAVYAICARVVP